MTSEIIMPRMGQGMDEGRVVLWLKPLGAPVKRGEAVAEVETDKANIEIEAPADGFLVEVLAAEGEMVAVGKAIARVGNALPRTQQTTQRAAAPGAATGKPGRVAASPLARRLAAERGLNLEQIAPTGPEGRVVKADILRALGAQSAAGASAQLAALEKDARVAASPLARRVAAELNVPLAAVTGSGPRGMVNKEDVLAFAQAGAQAGVAATQEATDETIAPLDAAPMAKPAPLSRMRQTIGRRMAESKGSVPHFYLSMDVEMGQALALRDSLKRRNQPVGLNAILLRAAALALQLHPAFNATYADEGISAHAEINLAMAVALDEGLLTPVIHRCEALTLTQLAAASEAVIARARAGRLQPQDLEDATFTVSNLGMWGVRHFEAIINPPQVGILAVGAVRREPRFDEQERVIPGQVLTATLSADHRAVDGAQGARFLADFRDLLEDGFALV
jgi:pyruvate dehydrogenase E2 component (dihydrolipoamide acetyltransferase)